MILKGFKLLKGKPSGKLPVSYAQNYSQDTVISAVDGFVDTPVDIDDPGFPELQKPDTLKSPGKPVKSNAA